MSSRPRKPWRVTLTGVDFRATSEHTSGRAAYALVDAALRGESPATEGRVDRWENGGWCHFETVEPTDIPPSGGAS